MGFCNWPKVTQQVTEKYLSTHRPQLWTGKVCLVSLAQLTFIDAFSMLGCFLGRALWGLKALESCDPGRPVPALCCPVLLMFVPG